MAKIIQYQEWFYRWIVTALLVILVSLLGGIYNGMAEVRQTYAVHTATDEVRHTNVVYRLQSLERRHRFPNNRVKPSNDMIYKEDRIDDVKPVF